MHIMQKSSKYVKQDNIVMNNMLFFAIFLYVSHSGAQRPLALFFQHGECL